MQLTDLPDDAYLRVFNADRTLTEEEAAAVEAALAGFLGEWESHEMPVRGTFELIHRRFIVVGADGNPGPISGCSKDAMTSRIREIGVQLGVDFVQAPPVCFRRGEEIVCVDRPAFGNLVEKGEVNACTVVFDNTLYQVGQFKSGRFELDASDCWHGRAFNLENA